MSNQLAIFNRVRYTLYSDVLEPLVIQEPANWNDDEKELIRSEKYFGIMTNLSNNLEFYKDAYFYIKSNYDLRGIKMNVRLEKEERNELTDIWEISYTGHLDGSTYKADKNYIRIKFNESQFFKNIESSIKTKYELERLDTLKNTPLLPLVYSNLSLEGRDIFRGSLLRNDKAYFMYKTSSPYVIDFFSFPFELIYKSDENVFRPSIAVNETTGQIDNFTAFSGASGLTIGQCIYITADNTREINVKIKGDFKFQYFGGGSRDLRFVLYRVLYNEETNEFVSGSQIVNDLVPEFTLTNATGQVTKSIDFDITFNKRLTECFFVAGVWAGNSYPLRIDYQNCSVTLEETQFSETTNCKTVRVFDAMDRILQIITGKQCFQSDLLNNEWRDLLLTNGFKIRQFTDKNITTSLEEILEGLMAIDDVGLFIQNNTVRLEKKSRAFVNEVGIDLGEVNDIKREIIEKLHYSTIEIGTNFDGKYEEVNGLDEFNIKSTYTTSIDVVDNSLKAVSKIRYDAYGITLEQQYPFQDFPKRDTAFQKENFFIDAKKIGDIYSVRHWEDDFDTEPTGIFSPGTAFNLRLSPFNSLLRKSKTISVGLQKYPTELLKYSSTEGNSQLVTVYPERAVVQNNVLLSPYFLPEQITFERKITMTEFQTIVNNPYKLIKFVNEYGEVEYGFIYPSVKPNKEGKFTLIKANY